MCRTPSWQQVESAGSSHKLQRQPGSALLQDPSKAAVTCHSCWPLCNTQIQAPPANILQDSTTACNQHAFKAQLAIPASPVAAQDQHPRGLAILNTSAQPQPLLHAAHISRCIFRPMVLLAWQHSSCLPALPPGNPECSEELWEYVPQHVANCKVYFGEGSPRSLLSIMSWLVLNADPMLMRTARSGSGSKADSSCSIAQFLHLSWLLHNPEQTSRVTIMCHHVHSAVTGHQAQLLDVQS